MVQIIDGKAVAASVKQSVKERVSKMKEETGKVFQSFQPLFSSSKFIPSFLDARSRRYHPRKQTRLSNLCSKQEKSLRWTWNEFLRLWIAWHLFWSIHSLHHSVIFLLCIGGHSGHCRWVESQRGRSWNPHPAPLTSPHSSVQGSGCHLPGEGRRWIQSHQCRCHLHEGSRSHLRLLHTSCI